MVGTRKASGKGRFKQIKTPESIKTTTLTDYGIKFSLPTTLKLKDTIKDYGTLSKCRQAKLTKYTSK